MTVRGQYKTSSHDFRSDTFTTPTPSILQAGTNQTIGDAVFGEDDDTIALENKVAKLAGKEAGLYCVSGTLSNQIAIRSHLHQPPYSIICDYRAHIYSQEAAGLAMLSNAIVIPVIPKNGLYLTLEDIEEKVIPADGDIHGAPTRLISLENTISGVIHPIEEIERISDFARENGLKIHCDGARLWNASQETGIPLHKYGELFDSISLCLSKSLGAPIGSVLVGDKNLLKIANHFKKQCGGGIRQSGGLALMASTAIDENLPKLKGVHARAKDLAQHLVNNGIALYLPTDTNMIFVDVKKTPIDNEILDRLASDAGLKFWLPRFVLHFQTSDDAIEKAKRVIVEAYEETKKQPPKKKVTRKLLYHKAEKE